MSYVQIPSGIPNFSKATLSFWFKVPAASMQAAYDNIDVNNKEVTYDHQTYTIYQVMNGIIPLVVWGPQVNGAYLHRRGGHNLASYDLKASGYDGDPDSVAGTACSYIRINDLGPQSVIDTTSETGPSYPLDPCSIGIDVTNFGSTGAGQLRINLQYQHAGKGTWFNYDTTGVVSDPIMYQLGGGIDPGISECGGNKPELTPDKNKNLVWVQPDYNPFKQTWTVGDATAPVLAGSPERIVIPIEDVNIAPDIWHHVIVSFDASGTMQSAGFLYDSQDSGAAIPPGTISTGCKMWVAIDDADTNTCSQYNMDTYGLDANAIISENCKAGATPNPMNYLLGPTARYFSPGFITGYLELFRFQGFEARTFQWTPPPIASDGQPFGLPATKSFVANIHHCEMAEFQLWRGLVVDTSVEKNRRAFLDYKKDPSGATVGKNLTPVNPAIAAKQFSRQTLMLHGSGNWVKGDNTGAAHVEFAPTGVIKPYKPDPVLGA